MAKLSNTEATRRQELGSAWIFRRALKDNIRYNSWEDILKDPKFDELGGPKGIYPEFTTEWIKTFYLQQKKMLDEFSDAKFTEFNREHGFMGFITNILRNKFGVSKKDNYDPADIWCIKNEKKVMTDIQKIIQEGSLSSLGELGAYLRTLFVERVVVGISLKKISGKTAHYEEVNIDDTNFADLKNHCFDISKIKIDFSLKNNGEFKSTDTIIVLDALEDNKKLQYNFQIRASGSGFNNLKWEPTLSSAGKARLGKVPVEMAANEMKKYGMNYVNNHNIFPKTLQQFFKDKDKYVKMFNFVNKKSETNIKDSDRFLINMYEVFENDPSVATSKLMQLHFLSELLKLPQKQPDKIMTSFAFLAQKKGSTFGPFGKLY